MKRLSMKIVASVLSSAMLLTALVGCGGQTGKTPDASGSAAPGESAQAAAPAGESKGQIIVGTTTEPTGDMAPPYWQNGATDAEINRNLIRGMSVYEPTIDGDVVENKTVLEKVETKENEDGTKTYTFTIKKGLEFSDGTPVNAKHYVADALFFASPVLKAAQAKTALSGSSRFVGFEEYSKGETPFLKGVRLLGDDTFSLTLKKEYNPNFYETLSVAAAPLPYEYWTKNDAGAVDVIDNGEGAGFNEFFTVDNCLARIDEVRRDIHLPSSGPYKVKEFDQANQQIVLELNDKFPGTFDGKKGSIATIIYKKVNQQTQVDELKTGSIDLLTNMMAGKEIDSCMELVENGSNGVQFDYFDYPRAGFGKIQFICDIGPTQFIEVRQAIAHLLNRDDFVKQFTGGHGNVVNGPYGEGQWFYKQAEKDLKGRLNSYSYSLEDAKKLLDEGGWTKNAQGGEYTEGLRYKEVDGQLMPLKIRWASSEKNAVSDLLVTLLKENKDVKAAGIEIDREEMTFEELLNWLYRDASKGDKYGVPTYSMFNLASTFPLGNVPEYDFTIDPEKLKEGYNNNFIVDQKLWDLSQAYWKIAPTERDKFVQGWSDYIVRWNELLPDLPLYSNQIHDFFNKKLVGYEMSANIDTSYALVRAHVE